MKQSVDLIHSMTLMKSRHHNTTQYLTGFVRRALMLLFLLVVSIGCAWGQLTITDLTGSLYTGGSTTVNLNTSTDLVYGDGNVYYLNYADLSDYKMLELVVNDGSPRLLFNRVSDGGTLTEINPSNGNFTKYVTAQGNMWKVDLEKIRVNEGGYVHLNAIKANNGQTINVQSLKLFRHPSELSTTHFNTSAVFNTGLAVENQRVIYGLSSETITSEYYANLSSYSKLVIAFSGTIPRLIFNEPNRVEESNSTQTYSTISYGLMTIDLAAIRNANGSCNLNSIKAWGGTTTVFSAHLYTETEWESLTMFPKGISLQNRYEYGNYIINADQFSDITVGTKIRIYESYNSQIYTAYPDNGWQNIFGGHWTPDALMWDSEEGCVVITLTDPADVEKLKAFGLIFNPEGGQNFYRITKENPSDDDFLGQAKNTATTKTGSKVIGWNDTSASFDLSGADLTGAKYARVYLIDSDGNSLTDQSGLSVTYNGMPAVTAGNSPTNGVYVYDSGSSLNLSNISVTLTGTAGTLDQYKIVCLLSTSEGTPAAGPLTREPNWDLTYTYTFIYPFAGNLKSGYFSHSREVLLTTSDIAAGRVQIPFNEALDRIKSEYVRTNVATTGSQALASNLHIRWFVTCNGEMIANSEDYLDPITTGTDHHQKTGYGYYWNSATSPNGNPLNGSSNDGSAETKNWLNMNFTKPASGVWHDYKVVIWLSDDTSAANGQVYDSNTNTLTHEPDINMVYTYSFFVEDNFKFVHSKGAAVEAYPSLPYLIKGSSVQQYDWDNSTSSIVASTIGDTRQDVHTLTYDVYLQPNSGLQPLKLSFQKYMGNGEVLEPAAYIRWYDWTTDLGTDMLSINNPSGSWLEKFTDSDTGNSRGLFFLNREKQAMYPRHSTVGVNFNTAALASLDENGYYEIACDVSKYYDGIYRSSNDDTRPNFEGLKHPYLLHEPTLSLRYIFRIHPASVIAGKILTGNTKLSSGITSLTSGTGYTNEVKTNMFNDICEDNGRVVVSLNNGVGKFALRTNLPSLGDYYINSGNTQCNHITWKAYLEDASGLWERSGAVLSNSTDRIHLFQLSDLSGTYNGDYVTAATGMRFHMVGFVGDESSEQAAVHYELEFIDAPAILVDDLRELSESGSAEEKAKVKVRRKDYLDTNMIFGGRVSFDEFFSTTTLANQNENHTEKPLPWEDAQYGYCYPQIDNYRIGTNDQSGLTPIHGDYILLKSICGTYSKHWDNNQPYKYFFWRPANQLNYDHVAQEKLYDFTNLYGDDDTKYGGFLYVDAADEARTIASLDFNAHLCTGSQITFTAAIADVTNGDNYPDDPTHYRTPPQLMIRVYGVDASGKKTEKPIVSFLTGSLRSVSRKPLHYLDRSTDDYRFMEWYQAYGYTTIPSNADIQNYTTFIADVDNYCENTDGADYCVDEIRFYTSSGKVNVKMDGGTCADENMTFTANIDVEHLENRISLSSTVEKHLYYRFYEKTGESNGQVQYQLYPQNASDYNSIYSNGNKSYGDVSIWKYELDGSGNLTTSLHNKNYEKVGEDLYFDILDGQTINLEQGKSYFIALTRDLDIAESMLSDPDVWSSPNDACDIYSNFFVPRLKFVHFLSLDDEKEVVSQIIEGVCGQPNEAHKEFYIQTNYPDDNELTGFKRLPLGTDQSLSDDGVLFDYFLGTEQELKQNYVDSQNNVYSKSLLDALQEYREFERTHDFITKYSVGPASGYNGWGNDDDTKNLTRTNYAILKDACDRGKLLMTASSKFVYDLFETQTFLALPVNQSYVFGGVPYELCNYIPFEFTVNGGFNIPDLTLGFDDVDYTAAGRERVIRVGLEQLNKMKKKEDGYLLHVPVNMYLDKHRQSFKKLYFPRDSYFTISAVDRDADPLVPNTTDPQLLNDASNAIGKKFAKIVPTISGDSRPAVDKTHMYLALDLSDCEIDFHEGYQYEVATNFFDEDDEALNGNPDARACIGDLFLMIKVVPEFVTWHSQYVDDDGRTTATNTGYRSANWYNDDNWQRSTRAEMYKDVNSNNPQQNTPTEGHPNGYDDNGEGSLIGLTSGSNPGFVPMKFTYVILPTGQPAPSLINEPRVEGVGVGDQNQGGGFLDLTKTTLLTDRSPRDPDGTPDNQRTSSKPTENIYYDLLVRYSYKEGDPYGEGCFGHRKLRDDLLNSTDPLTAAQVTAYNNAMANKAEGDKLTPVEAKAYNSVISGNGQLNSGVGLTADQATAYNAVMKANKAEGDTLTPEEAQAYNSVISGNGQLDSGIGLTAEQATAYNTVMRKVAGNVLTAAEAHAYNWDNQGTADMTAKVFDCEKYQGNVCHDIYFKPGAELLRQQRLTYKRAWVETELYANKWYLLASPLQCTYAGDMYVPPMMTDVATGTTVKGRQVTEAFQPITFNTSAVAATSTTTSQPAYSRTLFPIYQRSWGTTLGNGSTNNGKVYVKENDIRATYYSANLKFSSVTTNFAEWGHTFNDVQVPYHTSDNALAQNLAGFSIRAHKKDQTDKVLIRLPKADTSYEYFDWTNTSSDPAAETPSNSIKSVSKPDYNFKFDPEDPNEPSLFTVPTSYRLVTDEHHHDGDMEYSVNAMQQNNGYVLVGNPYMVSIDMKKFFITNSSLDQTGYWTYEVKEVNNVVTGEMKAYTKPTQTNTNLVKPMQAFFVKKGTATTITFNKDMQVDGNFHPAPDNNSGARQVTVTLCAANSSGNSSASLELSDMASADYISGEDVETLFDSNLAEVPMVYTVASGQAVSINQMPEMETVPFGVTCSSNETVEMNICLSPLITDHSSLFVFDALTGTTTAVNDGESISVQPNDYGRYYLTVHSSLNEMKGDMTDAIIISVRNGVVSVQAKSNINEVHAVNISGTMVHSEANCGTSTQFTLQQGTYVIEAESADSKRTAKIVVK